MPKSADERKPVNLALQGGGAHGAFTWGVLDCFLGEDRLVIEAISGTSAGAMNAVVAADGLMKGGPEGAREALQTFWRAVSKSAMASPFQRSMADIFSGNWNLDRAPGYLFFDLFSRMASPYDLNPFNHNPLRDFLAETINFERVRCCSSLKLFVAATCVQTGKVRIFEQTQLSPDVVMASACLPLMFQAVPIEGRDYWDGGYSGNPPLFPLAYRCAAPDVIIVQINPQRCRETPRSAREILNRINEITFNANLLAELRAIEFVGRLLDEGSLDSRRYKKMLVHLIPAEEGFEALNASSKLNAEWKFLLHLHDLGYKAARQWIETHFEALGKRSTFDLRAYIH